ncbi:helix-turn-helix domain-containing protein [Gluconacetobacter tumulisoli]|uniref:helix-turn-helix domain-containing protein n=1 Tax=Gluconacetobacter tumulisoli TaxID=1286189 RepID=UPI003083EF32
MAVLTVQRWLRDADPRAVSATAMAAQAGLEERTFLRRFHKATGLTPIEYCQHLRISRARDLMESTTASIDEIAWQAGYDDSGSFRKLFIRITGLAPREYRRRFASPP